MSNQFIPEHKFPVDVCGIFKITEILNDRWTILLLREAFYGVTKFNDFLENTGISKQVLTDRLKHLVQLEIFELSIYKEVGVRERKEYLLTKKGKSLNIVLLAMLESGGNFIEEGKDVVKVFDKSTDEELKLKLVDSSNQVIDLNNLELKLIHSKK
ncbi:MULTISPECIES: winged helix-turn-helix transcriptional regulator [Acinetobacter]|uniref:Helix-turn-helix transcriptional regulator n=1 Tax=Acinetobacter seifertii TaxID=1530123 RepID=A0A7H2Q4B8_9GAMM|nr:MULTISPECIES: helix-turn-helix domain-containing protein [Acinetobacter]MEB3795149.1 helix-turn-helix transcriptional regulator [Acinetobacter sp. IK24]MEB3814272.1 helix-turn-helix transcriptional regulator [Acinetobacter sp. IK22]MEB3833354.1 helix-turn-helix transcriptional regulator [Acinetobacter sp. IK23]MEB3838885.1 helix-turn-helix transcriptional regulator [Acinetobacter sp. IK25]ONN52487.1 transcriptional regulator [Acinetobacter genomosp. 33YU]